MLWGSQRTMEGVQKHGGGYEGVEGGGGAAGATSEHVAAGTVKKKASHRHSMDSALCHPYFPRPAFM